MTYQNELPNVSSFLKQAVFVIKPSRFVITIMKTIYKFFVIFHGIKKKVRLQYEMQNQESLEFWRTL